VSRGRTADTGANEGGVGVDALESKIVIEWDAQETFVEID